MAEFANTADSNLAVEAVNSYEAREQLIDLLSAAMEKYVLYHGPIHFYGCPGDDTCDCTYKPLNDAVNQALRLARERK